MMLDTVGHLTNHIDQLVKDIDQSDWSELAGLKQEFKRQIVALRKELLEKIDAAVGELRAEQNVKHMISANRHAADFLRRVV
jgi:hypothetical protein